MADVYEGDIDSLSDTWVDVSENVIATCSFCGLDVLSTDASAEKLGRVHHASCWNERVAYQRTESES